MEHGLVEVELNAVVRVFDDLVIAQAVGVSSAAAAADVEGALAALNERVSDLLSRVHPRELPRLIRGDTVRVGRVELDLHEVVEPLGGEDERAWLASPVDVVERRWPDGLLWTNVLGQDVSAWSTGEEWGPQLQSELRELAMTTAAQRPLAERVWVEPMTVAFAPLELSGLAPHELWRPVYDREELEQGGDPGAPELEVVAKCWTSEGAEDSPAHERAEELDRLEALLDGQRGAAVVLVGSARVGKTALVRALTATWRESGERELWHASAPRLVSAPQMSAGWQQQCEEALGALERRGAVLYMGRLVEALDAGRAEGTDYTLARLLKPWLDGRRVRLVAEATEAEWARVQREDAGLAGAFFALRVEELGLERGERVIEQVAEVLSVREEVRFTPRALLRAWGLQRRFATHGSPVGRTIDFLSSVARRVSNRGGEEVSERAVVTAFCEATGLPEFMLLDERALDLDDVAQTLSQRVLGQEIAVRRVAEVIAITKAGMASPKKPLGTFLFVGPTGVGKTELARALSAFLFGDEERMVRLDMSEYSGPDAFARLIGDGNEEGALSAPVRRQPFSVVLLDEIEKAHASAFDVLLQVLGEARLTDAAGRVARFQNTIVIMTSNLGVDTLRPAIGFGGAGPGSAGAHFRKEAERFFRPEFLARVDELIPFGSLDPGVVRTLAERELEGVRDRWGMARPGVSFEYDEELAGWLVERGFDPKYGARPLKRAVERAVVWPLSERLARVSASGDDGVMIRASLVDGDISWEIGTRPRAQTDERGALIERIERISQLRRRLDAYTWTELFADLEWQLASYEQRSVLEDFWSDPDASEVTARAERARRVVAPARALALELAALEDLAHEAYYDEQFELHEDLRERLDELEPALRELFVVLLRSGYEDPDRVLVVLRAMPGARDARAQLEEWYAGRAASRNWSLRRFVPLDGGGEEPPEDGWRELDDDEAPTSDVLMLFIEGEATRPLYAPEDGLHRIVSGTRGQAVADVICVSEHIGWPDARTFDAPRANPATARVWNLRKGEVTIPFVEVIPFDPARPWKALEGRVEELAWVMLEGPDWDDENG